MNERIYTIVEGCVLRSSWWQAVWWTFDGRGQLVGVAHSFAGALDQVALIEDSLEGLSS